MNKLLFHGIHQPNYRLSSSKKDYIKVSIQLKYSKIYHTILITLYIKLKLYSIKDAVIYNTEDSNLQLIIIFKHEMRTNGGVISFSSSIKIILLASQIFCWCTTFVTLNPLARWKLYITLGTCYMNSLKVSSSFVLLTAFLTGIQISLYM